jgi:hypothetical protein
MCRRIDRFELDPFFDLGKILLRGLRIDTDRHVVVPTGVLNWGQLACDKL